METGRLSGEKGVGANRKNKSSSFGGAAHRGQLPATKGRVWRESDVCVPCGSSNYCTQRTVHIQKHQINILDECVLEMDGVIS